MGAVRACVRSEAVAAMSDHADTIRRYLWNTIPGHWPPVGIDAAHAALDALLAERQQAQDDLVRCQQARRIAIDGRQQAIEALREIAGFGKYLEESGGAKLKLPKAVTIARSVLAKLGEQP